MADKFDNIKNNTTCPDCGGKEMVLGFGTSEGSIYKASTFLGMNAYSYGTDRISIICCSCGLIVKEYAKDPSKMK